ncbi:hypothetical protein [Okeania sp. SIO1H2]|nr:hypothetical protein [Okeania sp. SIO1H2]
MKLVAVAGSNHEQSSAPATNIPLVNVVDDTEFAAVVRMVNKPENMVWCV